MYFIPKVENRYDNVQSVKIARQGSISLSSKTKYQVNLEPYLLSSPELASL